MHPLTDPVYIQNQALLWIGVAVAILTAAINAYHTLQSLWLAKANKERLDSQSSTIKTLLLNSSSPSPSGVTVNAPNASPLNVTDNSGSGDSGGQEASPAAPAPDWEGIQAEIDRRVTEAQDKIRQTPLDINLTRRLNVSDMAPPPAALQPPAAPVMPLQGPSSPAQAFDASGAATTPPTPAAAALNGDNS